MFMLLEYFAKIKRVTKAESFGNLGYGKLPALQKFFTLFDPVIFQKGKNSSAGILFETAVHIVKIMMKNIFQHSTGDFL